ncbi:MAG: penicillin-binding protein, partial [Deltaproteobacteria bacterium]|nr:penicillin-binding protein [Deltaproteobacteria bacterium]
SYLPFTCDGSYVQPTLIQRITTSSGKALYRHRQRPQHVLKEKAAREMKKMLIRAVASGTGQKARGIPGVSGGKTGTSNKSRDAWFIGFHDQLITGVWVGHDKNQSLGKNENGGRTAAPIWRSFMGTVYR